MKFSSVLAALSAIGSTLAQQTYTNPVLWYDLADIDVFRKGNQYYYSASTMSFSPGAPILRSGDLVNWEFIGHSVPRLDFHDTAYDLADGKQAYVRGIWASFGIFNFAESALGGQVTVKSFELALGSK